MLIGSNSYQSHLQFRFFFLFIPPTFNWLGGTALPASVAKLLSAAGGGQGKVVLVPQSAVAAGTPASLRQQESSTPSATLSLSDGPATTDAALAALAAEAGLIDMPEAVATPTAAAPAATTPTAAAPAAAAGLDNVDALQLLAGMSAEMDDVKLGNIGIRACQSFCTKT